MIFIDSSYLIALSIKSDKNNKCVKELKQYLNEKRVITEIVFIEKEDYLDVMDICDYYNNAINFSDCIILNAMQKLHINKIESFDKGFDKIYRINRIY